jgi:hypothetical protein
VEVGEDELEGFFFFLSISFVFFVAGAVLLVMAVEVALDGGRGPAAAGAKVDEGVGVEVCRRGIWGAV